MHWIGLVAFGGSVLQFHEVIASGVTFTIATIGATLTALYSVRMAIVL
jgi:hypothetical protein